VGEAKMSVKKHDLDKFLSEYFLSISAISDHITINMKSWRARKGKPGARLAKENFNVFKYTWRGNSYAIITEAKVPWITCIIFCIDRDNYLKTKVVHVKSVSSDVIFKAIQCDDYLVLYGHQSALCLDLSKIEKASNFARIEAKSHMKIDDTIIACGHYCGGNVLVLTGYDRESYAKCAEALKIAHVIRLPDMQMSNRIEVDKWHRISSIGTDPYGNIVINCTNHEAAKYGSSFYIVGMARYVIDRDSMAVIRKETKT
jgi:hypothetical protein